MDYSNESWIKVYTRNTAGWLATSLGARALSFELSRAMGRFTDEIRLGPRGLRAVPALVGSTWEEVEPLLQELLADGRLEYDADEQVLRDPQHSCRQRAATSMAQRKRDSRKSADVTRGHTTSRDVTRGHDQREEREETEERETRAREGDADAIEPEPEPSPSSEPPWVDPTLASVELSTGETFDRGVVWTKYQATRERDRRALSAADFRAFLASWASTQKSDRIAAREREASGPRLVVARASPEEPKPAPYHRESPIAAPDVEPDAPATRPRVIKRVRRSEAELEAARRLAAGDFG